MGENILFRITLLLNTPNNWFSTAASYRVKNVEVLLCDLVWSEEVMQAHIWTWKVFSGSRWEINSPPAWPITLTEFVRIPLHRKFSGHRAKRTSCIVLLFCYPKKNSKTSVLLILYHIYITIRICFSFTAHLIWSTSRRRTEGDVLFRIFLWVKTCMSDA